MTSPTLRGRRPAVALIVLSALLASGCGGSTGGGASSVTTSVTTRARTAGADGVIKIGLLSTLNGTFAALGQAANYGAKLALLDAGAKLAGAGDRAGITDLTIGGQNVQLIVESSDTKPAVALAAARRLVDREHVDILVGPLSGDEGLAVKGYAKLHPEVTFVNGASAAQNVTLRDPVPNFFRFTTDGAQWAAGLGGYAVATLHYRRVATLAEDYSFPYDQVGGFMAAFCASGGKVPQKIWVPLGTGDFSAFIAAIPKGIDALYIALGGTDAVSLIKQLDVSSFKGIPILGGSITVDGSVIKALGKRAEGIVSAGPVAVLDTAEYRDYAAKLKVNFPQAGPPGIFDIGYYTEMTATLRALTEVDGTLDDGHVALNAALAKLTLTTPTGPVRLDQNRQAVANNYLFQVRHGEKKLIKTLHDVNQTLGLDRDAYIAQPANDRDHPSCP